MTLRAADSQMGVARSIKALRARVDGWRANGLTIGFVPTMGALHKGHLSLVKMATGLADRCVASIFVNPRQFAPDEDLATYPRNEAQDLELLQEAGCHLAYVPPVEEMYPEGFQTSVGVSELSQGLCGASRPHFFGGVATVVCKLLNQCRPDVAVFGEKDYQQLLVVRRMAHDLDLHVDVVGAPVVREPDGLAISSRNAYLAPEQRVVAGRLNKIIAYIADALTAGARVDSELENGRNRMTEAGLSVDYLEVRSALDLAPLGPGPLAPEPPARVFAAALVGKTRLIDNWPVDLRVGA